MKHDIIIIGCGIVGLTLAHKLLEKNSKLNIAILEKESQEGFHASGRNSGVLHAGFYYTSDSLKAKFTRMGNESMREYCKDNKIPVFKNGKLVVTKDETELEGLHELERRGIKNKVDVSLITAEEAYKIEPHAKTHELALYSPLTATVDPKLVCRQLLHDLKKKGVKFYFDTPYLKKNNDGISAGKLNFQAHTYINAAGLYADKVAADFGAGQDYTIVPFKGVYLECTDADIGLKTNIYPVPNLKNPFLGVHFTVTPTGKVKIGPTAIPAFWRENYKGLSAFNIEEFYSVITTQMRLFKNNSFNFRSLAWEEMKKFNSRYLQSLAQYLVKDMNLNQFNKWGNPGIRAQLLDKRDMKLVQDFVVEKKGNSIHVLNAVSPAFTCSFPFSEWIVENYLQDII